MFRSRTPCMSMNLSTPQQRAAMSQSRPTQEQPRIPTVLQGRQRHAGGMFSIDMSHIRGARPCGSCGGR